MTGPSVTIEPTSIALAPGSQQRVLVTVKNHGKIVEGFRIDVLDDTEGGGPAAWAEVTPPEINVYPGDSGSASLVFTAPEGKAAPSGTFAFAVRATSVATPGARAVAEGDLEVGRVYGVQATMTPVTSHGRWRGHHLLRFTNWGNGPVTLRLAPHDADERLGFLLTPSELSLPLGATATARLSVRTRKPVLRGRVARLPFEVRGESDEAHDRNAGVASAPGFPQRGTQLGAPIPGDPRRPVLMGGFEQKPIISRLTVALALVAVALLAGAVILAINRPAPALHFPLSEGPPSVPKAVAAQAEKDGTARVTWAAVRDVVGYKIVTSQAGKALGVVAVPAEQQGYQTTRLTPDTDYCFAVEAVRGNDNVSRLSKRACATTVSALVAAQAATSGTAASSAAPTSGLSSAPASAPASTAGGPSNGRHGTRPHHAASASSHSGTREGSSTTPFLPGEYVVLIGDPIKFRSGDRVTEARGERKIQSLANQLRAQGDPVGVMTSAEYPNLVIFDGTVWRTLAKEFWAIYVGVYPTVDQAAAVSQRCARRYLACPVVVPVP